MSGLRRVAAVYRQVERLRSIELQMAGAAVAEAERCGVAATAELAARVQSGRDALARGDAAAWRLAQSLQASAEKLVAGAEELRHEREVARAAAAEQHRASRLQTSQVARVVEDRERVREVLEGRREQAAADDRFGDRLRMKRD